MDNQNIGFWMQIDKSKIDWISINIETGFKKGRFKNTNENAVFVNIFIACVMCSVHKPESFIFLFSRWLWTVVSW